jgi:transposase
MAWTEFTRAGYESSGGRYASNASDAEWALVAPLLPAPKRVGQPRTTDLRDVFGAILYIATTGCQWRMLPNDFPPVSTMRRYFYYWRDNSLLEVLNRQLVAAARQAEGRAADPKAGVIDSQSVRTTESGGVRGRTPASDLTGASATSSPIPSSFLSSLPCMVPRFKIVTAPRASHLRHFAVDLSSIWRCSSQ